MPRLFKFDDVQSVPIDMERRCYKCDESTFGHEVVEFLNRDMQVIKIAHFLCEYPGLKIPENMRLKEPFTQMFHQNEATK